MNDRLEIWALGGLTLTVNGQPVMGFDSRKVPALLVYLVCTGHEHPREVLAEMLWEERTQTQSLSNLRVALTSLRQTVGPFVEITRDSVGLAAESDLWLDAAAFEEHLSAGRLRDAVDLYRGDFLAGFTVDSGAFEQWALRERERLRFRAMEALDRLVACALDDGDYSAGIDQATRLLGMDPLREETHRAMMALLARSGQRGAALAQYEECRRLLDEELGVTPMAETTALYARIKAGELGCEPPKGARAGGERREQPRHNLPPPPTRFIGREDEIAAIIERLNDPDCCLLTLVGPGGIGKTRLALQVAARTLDDFADGVFFVELMPLESPEAIVPAIAVTVGFQFYQRAETPVERTASLSQVTETPQEQLLGFLRDRAMLLILDNFEHLLAGAALVSTLLETAPHVKVLVTSRETLNLDWEWLYDVGGMTVPAEGPNGDVEGYSSVQLFIERARRAQPTFSPEENRPSLVRICRAVEGMPLAIELAAAWLRVLSCPEIAEEVEKSFDFLTSKDRAKAGRHSSLRAVFAHSWRLLADAERDALMKLSVSRGSFQREAAEVIAGASLPVLSALVDKSLLRHNPDGRYSLHEAVRQFAAEQLDGQPQVRAGTLDRHCAYYCAFLAEREADLKGARLKEAADEIAATIDNVRAAWQWAVQQRKVEPINQAHASLFHFYDVRGLVMEGRDVFEQAVAEWEATAPDEDDDVHPLMLARLLARYGGMVINLDEQAAIQPLERSLSLLRQHNDPPMRAFALGQLGLALTNSGKPEIGRPYLQESCDCYRALGDTFWLVLVLQYLGDTAAWLLESEEARRLYQESFDLAETIHNRYAAFGSVISLGAAAARVGEYPEAVAWYQKALAYAREVGNPPSMAYALGNLADTSFWAGDSDQAKQYATEQLAVAREAGLPRIVSYALRNLGWLAYMQGKLDEAEQCFQEAITDSATHRDEYASTLTGLAAVAGLRGDHAAARRYLEEKLAIHRELGNRWGEAASLGILGWSIFLSGAHMEARQYCEESLAIYRELGVRFSIAVQRTNLGHITAALGDDAASKQYYREALEEFGDMERTPAVLEIIAGIARHLANGGELARAVEVLTLATHHPATSSDVKQVAEPLLTELEAELPPEAFAEAWERGQALTLEEAVAYALEALSETDGDP